MCNGKSQTGNGKLSGQINPNIKIQKAKIKVNGEEIEGNLDLSKVIMPLEYYEALNKGNINEALEIRNDFLVKRQLIDKKKSEKKEIEIEKVNIDQERFDNAKKSHNDKIKKAIEDTELPDERKKRGPFSRISEMFRRPQFDPKYAFDICSKETKEKIRKLDPDKVDDCIKATELADISIDYAEEFLARYGKTGYQTICETLGDENKKISEQDIKEAIIDKGCEDEYNNEINEFDRIVEMIEARYGHKNEDQTIEINEKIERIYKSLSKKEIKKLKKEGILSKKAADQIREKIINPENEKRYLMQKERVEYVKQAIQENRGKLGYTIIEKNKFREGIKAKETSTVEETQEQSEIPEYQIIYNQLTDGNEEMKKQIMQYYDESKTYGEPCMRAVKLICKELAKKRNEIEIHDNGLKIEMDLAYYCDKIGAFYRDPNLSEISDKVYNSLSDESKESMKEDYRSGQFITLNDELEEAIKSEKTEYSNVAIERNIREKHAREDLNNKAQSIYESFLAEKHESSSSSALVYDDIERIAIKHKYIDGETLKQYEKLEKDAYKICNEIFSNICAEQYQNEFFSDNDYGYYGDTLLDLFYGGDSHDEY